MSTNTVFKEFIDQLKALEAQIADLQAEADSIRDLVKEELTTNGLDEVIVDRYKITYRNVISNRFDTTNFKKTHADLYQQFAKTTSYKRLTIN